MTTKTTKFKGDIQFVAENETILCSNLITETEADAKYALKNDIKEGYYTKTETDEKYALKNEIGDVDLSGYAKKCPIVISTDACYLTDGLTKWFSFKPGDTVRLAGKATLRSGLDGTFDWTGVIPDTTEDLNLPVSENFTLTLTSDGNYRWHWFNASLSGPVRDISWTAHDIVVQDDYLPKSEAEGKYVTKASGSFENHYSKTQTDSYYLKNENFETMKWTNIGWEEKVMHDDEFNNSYTSANFEGFTLTEGKKFKFSLSCNYYINDFPSVNKLSVEYCGFPKLGEKVNISELIFQSGSWDNVDYGWEKFINENSLKCVIRSDGIGIALKSSYIGIRSATIQIGEVNESFTTIDDFKNYFAKKPTTTITESRQKKLVNAHYELAGEFGETFNLTFMYGMLYYQFTGQIGISGDSSATITATSDSSSIEINVTKSTTDGYLTFSTEAILMTANVILPDEYALKSDLNELNGISYTKTESDNKYLLKSTADATYALLPPIGYVENRYYYQDGEYFIITGQFGEYFNMQFTQTSGQNIIFQGFLGNAGDSSYSPEYLDNEVVFTKKSENEIQIVGLKAIKVCTVLFDQTRDSYATTHELNNTNVELKKLKNELNTDFSTTGMTVTNSTATTDQNIATFLIPKLDKLSHAKIILGKSNTNSNAFVISYQYPDTARLGFPNDPDMIDITPTYVMIGGNTTIDGSLTVTGDIRFYGQLNPSTGTLQPTNQTITHYTPIEGLIDNFMIGAPVFLSGNVYKQDGDEWKISTNNDAQDCICSVKSSGKWNEFVGVVVKIDSEKNCLAFASHGDFLFYVDDSSIFKVGDSVSFDGKIVDENCVMTLKIQRSVVGIVSGKIDDHYLAIFRS